MKKSFYALLAVFVLLPLCACGALSGSGSQYQAGFHALESGDYPTAIKIFTASIENLPDQTQGYINLAEAYEAMGNLRQAREILQQGISAGADELFIQEKLNDYECYYGFGDTPVRAVRSITTFTSPKKATERSLYTADDMLYAKSFFTYNSRDNLLEALTYYRVPGDWIGYDDVEEELHCRKCRYTYDVDTLIQKVISYGNDENSLVPFSSHQYRLASRFDGSSSLVLEADLYEGYYLITEHLSFDSYQNPVDSVEYRVYESLDWVAFSNHLDELYADGHVVATADDMVEFPFPYGEEDTYVCRESTYNDRGDLIAVRETRPYADPSFLSIERYDEQGRVVESSYLKDDYNSTCTTTYDGNTSRSTYFLNQEAVNYAYRMNSENGGYSVQDYNSDDSPRYYSRYDGYGTPTMSIRYGHGGCVESEEDCEFLPDCITRTCYTLNKKLNHTIISERSEDGLHWTVTEYDADGSATYVQLYTVLDLNAALNELSNN